MKCTPDPARRAVLRRLHGQELTPEGLPPATEDPPVRGDQP